MTRFDPLARLLDLPDVADAAGEARSAVDRLRGNPALRTLGARAGAESALRGARASAELDGAAYDLDTVRAGAVADPVLRGAVRVAGAVGSLVELWSRSPRQVLAKAHLLAARDVVPPDALGRPTGSPEVAGRLDLLTELLTGETEAPAVVVAAVVHGELLTLRPFAGPNGVVARAAARLTLVTRGLDPGAVGVPEVGHLVRRPEYIGAANAYSTGTPDGLRAWLKHCCAAVVLGAEEGTALCADLVARPRQG